MGIRWGGGVVAAMKRTAVLLLVAWIATTCVLDAVRAAEEVCYQWRFSQGSSLWSEWYDSESAASGAAASWCGQAAGSAYNCSTRNRASFTCTFTPAGVDAVTFAMIVHRYCVSTAGTVTDNANITVAGQRRINPEGCPDPEEDPCEQFAGQEYRAMQAFSDYPDAGAEYRNPSNNNCAMSVKGMTCTAIPGGQYCLMTYEYQATRDDELEEAANQPGECAIVAGKRNCGLKEDGSGNDCAVIGGERVCFEGSVADEGAGPAPSGCWTTGSGGLLCGEDVDLQDSEGNPVQPDSSVRTTNNTWNFYGAGTVADRGVTQGTDGSTPDTAEQGEDGGACPDGGNCSGELGEMTEVDSFGELTQAFMDRVAAAPVVASVSNLGDALPAGSCPELEMELFGQTLSFSAPMCTIWNSIAPILSTVMLVAWGLLAARIVLSA